MCEGRGRAAMALSVGYGVVSVGCFGFVEEGDLLERMSRSLLVA